MEQVIRRLSIPFMAGKPRPLLDSGDLRDKIMSMNSNPKDDHPAVVKARPIFDKHRKPFISARETESMLLLQEINAKVSTSSSAQRRNND